ncbi:reverse transcriptase domain-containing protein [Tanacetum coccineum]
MVQSHPLGRKQKTTTRDEGWMNVPITFPPVPARDLSEEPLVVEAEVEGYLVRRIHIDEGASIEIMFEHCFNMLHLAIQARLVETQTTVSGFSGEQVKLLGKIELDVCFRGNKRCRRAIRKFTVIPAPSPYNIILGSGDNSIPGYYGITMRKRKKEAGCGATGRGATYQRLVDEAFRSQIGKNLEFYVDDMVVKSKTEREMLADIAETFDNLRRINMKLNPKKCSFGVREGKFLGYMVTSEGIRANPAKTKDIAEMQSPRTWGEMQALTGKLATLNCFLSRSAEKSLPFFETLKNITKVNKDDYSWTEEAEKAFQELKKTVLDLPALTTPQPKETLFVYLAASQDAASAVLLKLALALRHTSRRLRRYFEAHPITVITDQPIKNVLSKADTSGRLAPYSVELAAYTITYEPHSAVKGQILADFINETPVGSEAMVPRKTQYTVDLSRDSKEE